MNIGGPERRVHIGKNVHGTEMKGVLGCTATVISGDIYIGDWVLLGWQVHMYCGHHDIRKRNEARHRHPFKGYDIHIEEGAWIASNATLIGPCTIGKHSVIGAGSVVVPRTIVPEGELWAGNPARFIRKIDFDSTADTADAYET